MTSQQQSLVTVTVAGVALGMFQTRTGGETSAEIAKYRPGGMMKEKVRKGLSSVGDVTVTREWERERDLEQERWLHTVTGRADMIVSDQPLDENGSPYGKPTIFTGTLQSVNGGDSDAGSNDGKMLELVMTTSERA